MGAKGGGADNATIKFDKILKAIEEWRSINFYLQIKCVNNWTTHHNLICSLKLLFLFIKFYLFN